MLVSDIDSPVALNTEALRIAREMRQLGKFILRLSMEGECTTKLLDRHDQLQAELAAVDIVMNLH